MIIGDSWNFWSNLWTAIWAIWTIAISWLVAYITRRQYKLEKKKYRTQLSIDPNSLKWHIPRSYSMNKWELEYLKLVNYWDWYAKNITIELTHQNKDDLPILKTEKISLLWPWGTYSIFGLDIDSYISTYNECDLLSFKCTYTDWLGEEKSRKQSYNIWKDHMLTPQNHS